MTDQGATVDHQEREPAVGVVVLNWNNANDTVELLNSLDDLDYCNFCVVVCDNGSVDDSVKMIQSSRFARNHGFVYLDRSYCKIDGAHASTPQPFRLIIIQNGENLGFAGGNNAGIRYLLSSGSKFSYIWLLNNDTTVSRDALRELIWFAETDITIGAVQALLLRANKRDIIDSAGIQLRRRGGAFDAFQGRRVTDLPVHAGAMEIFGCCAAAAMYRTDAIARANGFDDGFFVINEDVDLAFRLRKMGYRAYLVLNSLVFHKRGISGPAQQRKGVIRFIAHKNKLTLMARWWPRSVIFPFLLFGITRAFLHAILDRDLPIRSWIDAILQVAAEFLHGTESSERKKLYARWTD